MKTTVAIVGGGPGGAVASMFLARAGIDSIIVERDRFPRFHVGEALQGECVNVLRLLGLKEAMDARHPSVRYGATVYGSSGENGFYVPVMGRADDGEIIERPIWQVRRSTMDQLLLDTALERGAMLVHGRAVAPVVDASNTVCGVRIRRAGSSQEETIRAKVVIDASGQGTFLANAGVTGPKRLGKYARQVGLFSHLHGVNRTEGKHRNDTLLFYRRMNHWAWHIPLEEDVVSLGIVVPLEYFRSRGESKRAFLLREMLELNPELAWRMEDAVLADDVYASTNYSYHVKGFTGPGHVCIGDAHRFIDPVFSFGVGIAMAEGQRSAEAITAHLGGGTNGHGHPFEAFERASEQGNDLYQTVTDGFWTNPMAFSTFVHRRYRADFLAVFAGRVYEEVTSPGMAALRRLIAGAEDKAARGVDISQWSTRTPAGLPVG